VRNLLTQLRAARSAAWNHTGMIILALQRVNGNKTAQFSNPFDENPSSAKHEFRQFIKAQKNE